MRSTHWRRTLLAAGLASLLAGAPLWLLRADRPEEEEETPARPEKAPPAGRSEEEEGDRPRRKVIRVEDDDAPSPTRPRAAPADVDLRAAAREARHPAVRKLFAGLAVPHDVVVLKPLDKVTVGSEKVLAGELWVAPLPDYVAPGDLDGPPTLHVLDKETGSRRLTDKPPVKRVTSLRYYEELAVDAVKAFKAEKLTDLSRKEQLAAAEQALAAVLRYHESAILSGQRRGPGWDAPRANLRKELLGVQIDRLQERADAEAWVEAVELAGRLAETYPEDADRARLAGPVGALAEAMPDDVKLLKRLRVLAERYAGTKLAEPVVKQLDKRAQALLADARKAEEQWAAKKDAAAKERAEALSKQAEEVWPYVAGLRAFQIRVGGAALTMRVGVRQLPEMLSPARALTDSERRAVELLFEGLVKPAPDRAGLWTYRPGLAEGRPRVIYLGRSFTLPRKGVWSDGKPLSVGDLRHTVQLLKKGRGTGLSGAWGELIDRVQLGEGAYHVEVLLKHGYLDPLAAMTFKVLPERTGLDPDSEAFARAPVGSGPFFFDKDRSRPKGAESLTLFANPEYGARLGKAGRPRIGAVEFVKFAPPEGKEGAEDPVVKEWKDKGLDLALDLSAAQAAALQKQAGVVVPLPPPGALNRRIYFLAVNHRHHQLKSANLRLALAHAIPREALLDEHFRGPLSKKVHKALNGPYPAGSWACDPALKGRKDPSSSDPYDPELAKTYLKRALEESRDKKVVLKLQYPSGDAALEAAMNALGEKVRAVLPELTLEPEGVEARALKREVEQTRENYHLAYYHYDFPGEALWLWPLLGPGGGDNYLGYSGPLRGKIQDATSLRDFAKVKAYARAIHKQFLGSEMPFVPLWQLDPLCARRAALEVVPFDPHTVFGDADRWELKR